MKIQYSLIFCTCDLHCSQCTLYSRRQKSFFLKNTRKSLTASLNIICYKRKCRRQYHRNRLYRGMSNLKFTWVSVISSSKKCASQSVEYMRGRKSKQSEMTEWDCITIFSSKQLFIAIWQSLIPCLISCWWRETRPTQFVW